MSVYNWEEIVKSKTEKELIDLIHSNFITELEAKLYALVELKSRSYDPEKLQYLLGDIKRELLASNQRLNKRTFKEYSILISPVGPMFLCLYSLASWIGSLKKYPTPEFLYIAIFCGVLTPIVFFISRFQMKRIDKKKSEQIEKNQKSIERLAEGSNIQHNT